MKDMHVNVNRPDDWALSAGIMPYQSTKTASIPSSATAAVSIPLTEDRCGPADLHTPPAVSRAAPPVMLTAKLKDRCQNVLRAVLLFTYSCVFMAWPSMVVVTAEWVLVPSAEIL